MYDYKPVNYIYIYTIKHVKNAEIHMLYMLCYMSVCAFDNDK